eukprot:1886150-Rhodomonas_salina.1
MADASGPDLVQNPTEIRRDSENVTSNFIQDYNETTARGLKAAGASRLNVGEISRHIKLHLEAAAKAFTTVESLCDHMR